MKKTTRYESNDGEIWDTKEEALFKDREIRALNILNILLIDKATECDKRVMAYIMAKYPKDMKKILTQL